MYQLEYFDINLFGGAGGGGKQISSIVQIERSSNGNLKFISVPVINDPSRHFSLAGSGIRQKFCNIEKLEIKKKKILKSKCETIKSEIY